MLDVGIGRYIKCLLHSGGYRASHFIQSYREFMVIYINFAIICTCRDDMLRKQDFVYICVDSDIMKV